MSGPDTQFYTEATTGYWQDLAAEIPQRYSSEPPYRYGYPVRLPDGRYLILPLRELPDGQSAVASLIVNQASFAVVDALASAMTAITRPIAHDVIVGLPTLGLTLAPRVASGLGHTRYVPFGYSRKFWYDDALSEPVTSITSPTAGKRLRLDPNLAGLVSGRRVILVDDAISTGATAVAAVHLLRRLNAEVVAIVVAMKQTNRWVAPMRELTLAEHVHAPFGGPQFRPSAEGWLPIEGTEPVMPSA